MAFVRSIILFGMIVMLTSGVYSQDKKDSKESKEPSKEKTSKMAGMLPFGWGKLGLTDAQKQEIYKIQGKYKEEIEKLEQKIKELKSMQQKEMVKVLTEEQRRKLVENITGEKEK